MLVVHGLPIEHVICIDWVECFGLLVKNFGRVIDSFEQKLATNLCAHLVFDKMPNRDFSSKDKSISVSISVYSHTFGQFKQNCGNFDVFSFGAFHVFLTLSLV